MNIGALLQLLISLLMLFSCISLVLLLFARLFSPLEILFNSFSTDSGHFGASSTMLIEFIFCLFKLLHTDLLYGPVSHNFAFLRMV